MAAVSLTSALPGAGSPARPDLLRRAWEGMLPLTLVAFLLYLGASALGYTSCRPAAVPYAAAADAVSKPGVCSGPVRGRPANWPFQPKKRNR